MFEDRKLESEIMPRLSYKSFLHTFILLSLFQLISSQTEIYLFIYFPVLSYFEKIKPVPDLSVAVGGDNKKVRPS